MEKWNEYCYSPAGGYFIVRTTIENRSKLEYDLHLNGVVIKDKRKDEESLVRSCFYDFGVEQDAALVGYSKECKSTFVESLFKRLKC